MSLIYQANGRPFVKDPIKAMSRRELERHCRALLNSLKNTSARLQLVACALHEENQNNDIFKMTEGILDKEHLFYIRKSIKDGSYQKNRELARITS